MPRIILDLGPGGGLEIVPDVDLSVDTDIVAVFPDTTVISQYFNSPALVQLVENMAQYFSPQANLDAFYNLIWNIDTASGYGLQVWGRIVNVDNIIQVTSGEFFGFNEGNFDGFTTSPAVIQGPFQSGQSNTGSYVLADAAYRQVILAKALFNICDGSIKAINQVLINLFKGRGNAYVVETGPLSLAYTFNFLLTPVEYATITQLNILPRPSGVATSVVQL